jgi:hypothetical protein
MPGLSIGRPDNGMVVALVALGVHFFAFRASRAPWQFRSNRPSLGQRVGGIS